MRSDYGPAGTERPWILVMIAFLLLITYVPIISVWLPNLLMGAAT